MLSKVLRLTLIRITYYLYYGAERGGTHAFPGAALLRSAVFCRSKLALVPSFSVVAVAGALRAAAAHPFVPTSPVQVRASSWWVAAGKNEGRPSLGGGAR